ncbi:hypothetical protein OA7_0000370 [Vibrio cyclitrophicus 1F53]|uniref:hypothetical protein n=2 Tax=Vibrio cyclitrophicus TaxID=47951 RepID=UPI00037BD874|nr:hypothetical protein [Vibrio cyclitrophicus]OEF34499.1 hypothetical protein OA7_09040 [Vibrio cyclitrophicus 1F53]OEF66551.1 hypothetical protein OAA_20235 [Vibrio cyclitrophicus 1F175]PMH30970.1 hypothetical protein BCU72_17380 [Vibrio cyclitrophicus]
METIELVDTAIKIGLGAFISGFSTYLVTTKNNKHQMVSSLIEKKVTILQSASENMDTYLIKLSDVLSWMDGVLRYGTTPGVITKKELDTFQIRKKDGQLIESRELSTKAISQLKLIGAFDAAKACEDIYDVENRFRIMVIFSHTIPTTSELADFKKEFNSIREKIDKEKQLYFEKLYV